MARPRQKDIPIPARPRAHTPLGEAVSPTADSASPWHVLTDRATRTIHAVRTALPRDGFKFFGTIIPWRPPLVLVRKLGPRRRATNVGRRLSAIEGRPSVPDTPSARQPVTLAVQKR